MTTPKPNEAELALARDRLGELADNAHDLQFVAETLAVYRVKLEQQGKEARLKMEAKLREMEAQVLKVFRDNSPVHFGLEDNDYGRGYMAAVAAVADDTSEDFKDVALRITDKRLREAQVAFVSFRISRTGAPTCRVLRIDENGTSAAGEGRTLDAALRELFRAPQGGAA